MKHAMPPEHLRKLAKHPQTTITALKFLPLGIHNLLQTLPMPWQPTKYVNVAYHRTGSITLITTKERTNQREYLRQWSTFIYNLKQHLQAQPFRKLKYPLFDDEEEVFDYAGAMGVRREALVMEEGGVAFGSFNAFLFDSSAFGIAKSLGVTIKGGPLFSMKESRGVRSVRMVGDENRVMYAYLYNNNTMGVKVYPYTYACVNKGVGLGVGCVDAMCGDTSADVSAGTSGIPDTTSMPSHTHTSPTHTPHTHTSPTHAPFLNGVTLQRTHPNLNPNLNHNLNPNLKRRPTEIPLLKPTKLNPNRRLLKRATLNTLKNPTKTTKKPLIKSLLQTKYFLTTRLEWTEAALQLIKQGHALLTALLNKKKLSYLLLDYNFNLKPLRVLTTKERKKSRLGTAFHLLRETLRMVKMVVDGYAWYACGEGDEYQLAEGVGRVMNSVGVLTGMYRYKYRVMKQIKVCKGYESIARGVMCTCKQRNAVVDAVDRRRGRGVNDVGDAVDAVDGVGDAVDGVGDAVDRSGSTYAHTHAQHTDECDILTNALFAPQWTVWVSLFRGHTSLLSSYINNLLLRITQGRTVNPKTVTKQRIESAYDLALRSRVENKGVLKYVSEAWKCWKADVAFEVPESLKGVVGRIVEERAQAYVRDAVGVRERILRSAGGVDGRNVSVGRGMDGSVGRDVSVGRGGVQGIVQGTQGTYSNTPYTHTTPYTHSTHTNTHRPTPYHTHTTPPIHTYVDKRTLKKNIGRITRLFLKEESLKQAAFLSQGPLLSPTEALTTYSLIANHYERTLKSKIPLNSTAESKLLLLALQRVSKEVMEEAQKDLSLTLLRIKRVLLTQRSFKEVGVKVRDCYVLGRVEYGVDGFERLVDAYVDQLLWYEGEERGVVGSRKECGVVELRSVLRYLYCECEEGGECEGGVTGDGMYGDGARGVTTHPHPHPHPNHSHSHSHCHTRIQCSIKGLIENIDYTLLSKILSLVMEEELVSYVISRCCATLVYKDMSVNTAVGVIKGLEFSSFIYELYGVIVDLMINGHHGRGNDAGSKVRGGDAGSKVRGDSNTSTTPYTTPYTYTTPNLHPNSTPSQCFRYRRIGDTIFLHSNTLNSNTLFKEVATRVLPGICTLQLTPLPPNTLILNNLQAHVSTTPSTNAWQLTPTLHAKVSVSNKGVLSFLGRVKRIIASGTGQPFVKVVSRWNDALVNFIGCYREAVVNTEGLVRDVGRLEESVCGVIKRGLCSKMPVRFPCVVFYAPVEYGGLGMLSIGMVYGIMGSMGVRGGVSVGSNTSDTGTYHSNTYRNTYRNTYSNTHSNTHSNIDSNTYRNTTPNHTTTNTTPNHTTIPNSTHIPSLLRYVKPWAQELTDSDTAWSEYHSRLTSSLTCTLHKDQVRDLLNTGLPRINTLYHRDRSILVYDRGYRERQHTKGIWTDRRHDGVLTETAEYKKDVLSALGGVQGILSHSLWPATGYSSWESVVFEQEARKTGRLTNAQKMGLNQLPNRRFTLWWSPCINRSNVYVGFQVQLDLTCIFMHGKIPNLKIGYIQVMKGHLWQKIHCSFVDGLVDGLGYEVRKEGVHKRKSFNLKGGADVVVRGVFKDVVLRSIEEEDSECGGEGEVKGMCEGEVKGGVKVGCVKGNGNSGSNTHTHSTDTHTHTNTTSSHSPSSHTPSSHNTARELWIDVQLRWGDYDSHNTAKYAKHRFLDCTADPLATYPSDKGILVAVDLCYNTFSAYGFMNSQLKQSLSLTLQRLMKSSASLLILRERVRRALGMHSAETPVLGTFLEVFKSRMVVDDSSVYRKGVLVSMGRIKSRVMDGVLMVADCEKGVMCLRRVRSSEVGRKRVSEACKSLSGREAFRMVEFLGGGDTLASVRGVLVEHLQGYLSEYAVALRSMSVKVPFKSLLKVKGVKEVLREGVLHGVCGGVCGGACGSVCGGVCGGVTGDHTDDHTGDHKDNHTNTTDTNTSDTHTGKSILKGDPNLLKVNLYDDWLQSCGPYTCFCRLMLILRAMDVDYEGYLRVLGVYETKKGCLWPTLSDDEWVSVEVSLRDVIVDEYCRRMGVNRNMLSQGEIMGILYGNESVEGKDGGVGGKMDSKMDGKVDGKVVQGTMHHQQQTSQYTSQQTPQYTPLHTPLHNPMHSASAPWRRGYLNYDRNIQDVLKKVDLYDAPQKNYKFKIPKTLIRSFILLSDLHTKIMGLLLYNQSSDSYAIAMLPQCATEKEILSPNLSNSNSLILKKYNLIGLIAINTSEECCAVMLRNYGVQDGCYVSIELPCFRVVCRGVDVGEGVGCFLVPEIWNYNMMKWLYDEKMVFGLSMGVPERFYSGVHRGV